MFETFGYEVILAVDGEDALQQFRKNRGKIQLLLLDAVLPKKSGATVYKEAKALSPEVRVIFTSGYSSDARLEKLVSDDGLCFLSKPVSPNIILAKVREVLDS
jgi:DNA-binding response OmpR family regulator